jgi:uncharacterized protein DUF1905/bacteriocin resistance YdeI/OmpD-like protein
MSRHAASDLRADGGVYPSPTPGVNGTDGARLSHYRLKLTHYPTGTARCENRRECAISGPEMTETLTCKAPLVVGYRGWMGVQLPHESAMVFGTRGQVSVTGTIDNCPYRGSVMPTGVGHFLAVNQALRRCLGATLGQQLEVRIHRVTKQRNMEIPRELLEAFQARPEATPWWDDLTPAMRRIATHWISSAKSTEVRAYRVSDVLRRAHRAFVKEGPFYPTKEDQPALSRPPELRKAKSATSEGTRSRGRLHGSS